jgi:hypothetical protein
VCMSGQDRTRLIGDYAIRDSLGESRFCDGQGKIGRVCPADIKGRVTEARKRTGKSIASSGKGGAS